jgi:uncharacterized integral membrane protein (TIGR00698 family)
VALAATFLQQHYGAPVMLFALLLGMTLNFLSTQGRCQAGIEFTARQVLRLGVALLGFRLTLSQVADLGWPPIAAVVLTVALTIAFGMALARLMGFNIFFGLLTGGAVAICGASAALALSAAMPAHPHKERATLFTVIGVSTLSTLAMVVYPLLAGELGMSAQEAGFFIGATVHDVAQVVGAAYSISHQAGDTATLVKLLRVALLLPVMMLLVGLTRLDLTSQAANSDQMNSPSRPPWLPWFAVGFTAVVAVNSTNLMPAAWVSAGVDVSQACLVMAMAAIGLKTHLKDISSVGWKPVSLMVAETLFLALLAIAVLPRLDL